jgi:hypothetical protein
MLVHISSHNGVAPNAVTAYLTDSDPEAGRYLTFMNVTPQEPPAHLVSPEGFRPPDSIFYPVWVGAHQSGFYRDAPPMRDALGWAVGPPTRFDYTYQCAESPGARDPCFAGMPDGGVRQLGPRQGRWAVWQ